MHCPSTFISMRCHGMWNAYSGTCQCVPFIESSYHQETFSVLSYAQGVVHLHTHCRTTQREYNRMPINDIPLYHFWGSERILYNVLYVCVTGRVKPLYTQLPRYNQNSLLRQASVIIDNIFIQSNSSSL